MEPNQIIEKGNSVSTFKMWALLVFGIVAFIILWLIGSGINASQPLSLIPAGIEYAFLGLGIFAVSLCICSIWGWICFFAERKKGKYISTSLKLFLSVTLVLDIVLLFLVLDRTGFFDFLGRSIN